MLFPAVRSSIERAGSVDAGTQCSVAAASMGSETVGGQVSRRAGTIERERGLRWARGAARLFVCGLCLLVGLVLLPAVVSAQNVTFAWASSAVTVSGMPELLPGAPDSRMDGWFTFDGAVLDAAPGDFTLGLFLDSILCGQVLTGDLDAVFVADGDPTGISEILLIDDAFGSIDQYHASFGTWSGGIVNGFPGYRVALELSLAEGPASTFPSDALPLDPPPVPNFPVRFARLVLDPDGGSTFNQTLLESDPGPDIFAAVPTIACPEPGFGAGLAFGAPIAALLVRRRGRGRR